MSYQSSKDTWRSFVLRHRRQLLIIASALYVAGGIAFGYIFFSKTQTMLQAPVLTTPPGPTQSVTRVKAMDATYGEVLGAVDEKTKDELAIPAEQRINILLLGVDQRDEQVARNEPTRTDTILLATLDLTNKTAGLLVFPRDLYVTIPDIRIPNYGPGPQMDRINTPHFWGDWLKYPGGGPELLKKTIEHNFGAHVDYYARIDFRGFEKAVDALGGVTVDVERALRDDRYPTEDYEYMTVYFPAGKQTLNGRRALQYVRTRNVDNDFGRGKRQQQVMIALVKQALTIDALPKLPSLLDILGKSFQTDIPLTEMLRLGSLAKDISTDDLITRQIDTKAVTGAITSGGASVLLPKKDEIDLLLQEVYYGAMVRREEPKIAVLSGVDRANAAGNLAKELEAQGYIVTRIDDADRKDYSESQLTYQNVKPYTIMMLTKLLKARAPALSISRDVRSSVTPVASDAEDVDITIIVGEDLATLAP